MFKINITQAIKEIKKAKAKKVLIQLPDGLKPKATNIIKQLQPYTKEVHIWTGTCYGACDLPKVKYDLILHFGHTAWPFYKEE